MPSQNYDHGYGYMYRTQEEEEEENEEEEEEGSAQEGSTTMLTLLPPRKRNPWFPPRRVHPAPARRMTQWWSPIRRIARVRARRAGIRRLRAMARQAAEGEGEERYEDDDEDER